MFLQILIGSITLAANGLLIFGLTTDVLVDFLTRLRRS